MKPNKYALIETIYEPALTAALNPETPGPYVLIITSISFPWDKIVGSLRPL